MTLLMGRIIQKLRKEQNLTQGQVAAALGVTTAAVSKWETDSTYPDISLLGPLTRLLKTNVDQLVNFKKALSELEVANFEKEARAIFETGDSQQAMDFCDALLKAYPSDDLLRFRLASVYIFYLNASSEESQMKHQLHEAIQSFEGLRTSENLELKQASLHVLASLYLMDEQLAKAEVVIEELPPVNQDPRMMKTTILYRREAYEESLKLSQLCLFQELRDASLNLYHIAKVARKQKEYEKAIEIVEIGIEMDKLLHIDQISGTNANYYLFKAEILAIQGKNDEALKELKKFIPALKTAFALKNPRNDLLFNQIALKDSSVSTQYIAERMADLIEQSEEFYPLLEDLRFSALLTELRMLKE